MINKHEMIKYNSSQQNYVVFSSCKYFANNEFFLLKQYFSIYLIISKTSK